MADIDKITVNSTTYNIKDATARDSISRSRVESQITAGDGITINQKYLSVSGVGFASVYLHFVSASQLSAGAVYTIATLPSSAKPAFNQALSSYDSPCYVIVSGSSGTLSIKPTENIAANKAVFVGGTYATL